MNVCHWFMKKIREFLSSKSPKFARKNSNPEINLRNVLAKPMEISDFQVLNIFKFFLESF